MKLLPSFSKAKSESIAPAVNIRKVFPTMEKRRQSVSANNDGKMLLAKYDSAQTTTRNSKHWQWSDNLSADASNSKEIRKVIRERARYERASNPYCTGMVNTLANGVIGSKGPVLQLDTGDEIFNAEIEELFKLHTKAIKFTRKLLTMRKAKSTDGEAFAQFTTHKFKKSPFTLNLVTVECDRVTDPEFTFGKSIRENNIDGVIIDGDGEPIEYKVLRYHPGDNLFSKLRDMFTADTISADYMLHWFRQDRPEQHRGICEFQAAMPYFSILRDYTNATLTAAQQAALLATFLQTENLPEEEFETVTDPETGEQVQVSRNPEPMDIFALEYGQIVSLPQGWKVAQTKAEQPTGTYTEFEKAILRQIARANQMPFNIAAGDSSGYNYASGRLDFQDFFRYLEIEREDMADFVLDPFTFQFFRELSATPEFRRYRDKLLPERYGVRVLPPHEWYFSNYQHVDPAKEANAFQTLRKSRGISLRTWFAQQGKDWRSEVVQQGIEKKFLAENGLSEEDVDTAAKNQISENNIDDEDENENENNEENANE